MQAGPGTALKVIETTLLLHLLMRLLADPGRLDGCGKRLEISIIGQVGEVVLLLAG